MEFVQQEINKYKNKLLSLVNNLINTQSINEEIYFNNEINKECEHLISLLNIKQNNILNQNNNNINLNPFPFQPNLILNAPQMNINQNQINQQPSIKNKFINIIFKNGITGGQYTVVCSTSEKISEMIQKFRIKSNDYNDNFFLFNGSILEPTSSLTLDKIGIPNFGIITYAKKLSVTN